MKTEYGQEMEAIKVFSAAIKFLKNHLVEQCQNEPFNTAEEKIHWVLTVPAIWDDAAKQFMREAAVEVNFILVELNAGADVGRYTSITHIRSVHICGYYFIIRQSLYMYNSMTMRYNLVS